MGGEVRATTYPEVPLKDLVTRIETGWSPVCSSKPPGLDEWGVIKLSAITTGRFIETEAKAFLSGSFPRTEFEVRAGDVLMARANGVKSLVGVACTVRKVRRHLLLPDLAFRLVSNPSKVDPTFLGLALSSAGLRDQIEAAMRGTSGQYKISKADVRHLRVPLPNFHEQQRIVAAHAVMEWRIAALERVRDKFRAAETALAAEVFANVGSPWPTARLESIATVAAGVTLGSEPVGEGTVELPYLRVANVLDGRIDTADLKRVRILRSQYERFALSKGDLLLTEGGDLDKLGRGAVWDGRIDQCLHQNHVFRVRCGEEMSPDFLSLYTSSDVGRSYFQRVGKQTTNLASINSTQVKNMPVPVPSLAEQEKLLGPIRSIRSRVAAVDRKLSKLRVIQQGVLEDLLSGRAVAGQRGEASRS
ncbi:hypothetical protein [Streptomyces sp. NRRL S-37]|uniref:restriction endonuclease subunit S n=1 Tax=Streptomyces sp. NRRL S-37 TaxID=1463903 RepID=UPI000AF54CEC|nr:hypothetical protein [Streptomyces sp. NRRL S-37]